VLAEAMRSHRNTISKHLDELVELGLLKRERWKRSYKFTLIEDLPEEFIDLHVGNKGFRSNRRKSKRSRPPEPEEAHTNVCMEKPDRASSCTDSRSEYAHVRVHVDEKRAQDRVHEYAHVRVHVDEDEKGEVQKPRRKKGKGEVREPPFRASETEGGMSASPSRSALGDEGRQPDGENVGYDENHEIEGLIEDPLDQVPRKFVPKQRAPDPALVSGIGKGVTPFPEAQGASQSDDLLKKDPGVPSPPITSPDGVLALLGDEVTEKWGSRAARSFPYELAPKGTITRKIESAILRKYTPDVVRDMIRLLVWDWEVARGVCFPFRPGIAYPDLDSLVQYHKELASRIETGFVYPSSQRGSLNTYRGLFIEKLERVADDDPF
jgi:hypothetical protein